ncbi:hypothetical protein F2Q70_00004260 [Brassica cretica]|uniref:RNase H type-1 domain-containing protein n=1 Tax=Brassica cretica TaxID=69181 RepID=A0A8S9IY98_BRACR|nr:hypothetical protein F2Q70_00004260 [Brassica cretica]
MDLGQPLLALVEVDESGWTVEGTFNLWGQEISLDMYQPCIRRPTFAKELERIATLLICFPDFNIIHVPRTRNQISDFLAKTARSFHRELHFIGYSIPVWLSRPP